MRRHIGTAVLALSALYSVVDLLGWMKPTFLRMRIHEGLLRTAAIVLASLTFKAVILLVGVVLAFWPERARPANSA